VPRWSKTPRQKLAAERWGQRCLAAVRLSVSGGGAPECDLQQQCSRYLALAHDVRNLLHSRGHIVLAPVTATK
jgi:hypothetical protein